MRKRCAICNVTDTGIVEVGLDCRPVVRRLLVTEDALISESHPPTKTRVKGVSKSELCKHSPNHVIADTISSSTHKYSSVYWIACEDKLAESISTQTLHHSHTTAAVSKLSQAASYPTKHNA